MHHDLAQQTALVTGATAGIGRATALALAARGADVVVHGRDEQRAADTVRRIEALGAKARFEPADLSDPAQVTALADRAGAVDILVNNAGIFHFARTVDTTPATFDAHIDINLRAPYLLVQALAPGMAERGRGAIINVSSGAAGTPGLGSGVYGATKAALESLTRVWAAEFGPAGVRVNAVAAGPTRTEGTAGYGDAFESAGQAVALRRLADPEEIAGAIAFMACSDASYVNGATLLAMGGQPALG
ncbi:MULTISPECIES: SDR family NAD(P)-dependent oxidoreductase [unclassified Streptomyces]|uniref:SDR family NAD(P)-dependent oxidoreductase n=1 Tax=unclassified Streptomyces TaxID=2593676 RepID=UPI000F6B8BD8|nr:MULTISPECIES: SDR family oxidoreductase [unclassified Streptomyces]AZM59062.1 short-chain dehydrogenase [Streptomyces sp. WAC 01438]RSM96830.1 short-chain dehydrogenase [Streptomyces sp. WAC 01420]